MIDSHLAALHDSDAQVRKTAATFPKVPEDDSVIVALVAALDDPAGEVRQAAAKSLASVMFVIGRRFALAKGLGDPGREGP